MLQSFKSQENIVARPRASVQSEMFFHAERSQELLQQRFCFIESLEHVARRFVESDILQVVRFLRELMLQSTSHTESNMLQWIARDADAKGVSRFIQAPILIATFMAGPLGLLIWLALREPAARRQGRFR